MHTTTRRAVLATALLALATSYAHAQDDISGTILNDDQGLYTFFQAPNTDDPFFAMDDAAFDFTYDFASGTVGLSDTQFIELENASGDSLLAIVFELNIDTNESDGFAAGNLVASLDGGLTTFNVFFGNTNTDGTPFNTTSIDNGVFSAFLSGAALDGPQVNIGFTGVVGAMDVAEPGVLALIALGGLAFGFSRRR